MTYEYEYVDDCAEVHRVERSYPIGQAPPQLLIYKEGRPYKARLIITGGAGPMSENWASWNKG